MNAISSSNFVDSRVEDSQNSSFVEASRNNHLANNSSSKEDNICDGCSLLVSPNFLSLIFDRSIQDFKSLCISCSEESFKKWKDNNSTKQL